CIAWVGREKAGTTDVCVGVYRVVLCLLRFGLPIWMITKWLLFLGQRWILGKVILNSSGKMLTILE
ncbi:hypothetical protein, partial [Synechococcus sp. WC10meta]|uniref:hypothetical protein n=1 Tax=Synechococcus sp. WC10meta TaxID=2964537 RepID=UPI0039C22535